jgi:ectoine hydroxylase-related dioxygenase (phytanoyl-CoA dioxygenase family)
VNAPGRAAQQVAESGSVVLERAIAPALVTELTRAIDRAMDASKVPFGDNEFLGKRTRRLFNLLARDPLFERVPLHEAVLPVVEAVLDPECLLSSLTAIEMNPGETAQPLHADDGSIAMPKPHPPITCTAIWALTDFTVENGGTDVVPGSHRADHSPRRHERSSADRRPTVMPAGSVLVYHGSLWHGGGANRSDARRLAIVANYCAGWVRQEECQLLALPREQVARFPSRLRRLVGYSTYRGLMGHVDQRDPESLLDPTVATNMVWSRIRTEPEERGRS